MFGGNPFFPPDDDIQNAFVRNQIAQWVLTHGGIEPETIKSANKYIRSILKVAPETELDLRALLIKKGDN